MSHCQLQSPTGSPQCTASCACSFMLPSASAEVVLTGSPLTHEYWLRRDRGTYGAAISAQNGSFPGSGTPVKGLYRYRVSCGELHVARALIFALEGAAVNIQGCTCCDVAQLQLIVFKIAHLLGLPPVSPFSSA